MGSPPSSRPCPPLHGSEPGTRRGWIRGDRWVRGCGQVYPSGKPWGAGTVWALFPLRPWTYVPSNRTKWRWPEAVYLSALCLCVLRELPHRPVSSFSLCVFEDLKVEPFTRDR